MKVYVSAAALVLALAALLQDAIAQDVVAQVVVTSDQQDDPTVTVAPVVGSTSNTTTTTNASSSSSSASSSDGAGLGATPGLEPPSTLVEHTDAMLKLCPPRHLAPHLVQQRAIPTNNWWGNLIAHDTQAKIQPIWANPYALSMVTDVAPYGLSVSYPFRSRVSGGASGNRGASRYYAHGIVREFQFSAAEFTTKPEFNVVDWADMGVQVAFTLPADPAKRLDASFVSGMAYTTAKYAQLTPQFVSTAVVTAVNGQALAHGASVTGATFEVAYNSGQTWMVFVLGGGELTLTLDGAGSTLTGARAFSGVVRVALAVDAAHKPQLAKYQACVVDGATVDVVDDKTYAFQWATSGDCSGGLLHFAMTHHLAALDKTNTRVVDGMVTRSTTRGAFTAIATTPTTATANATATNANPSLQWTLTETQAIPEGFYPPRKPKAALLSRHNVEQQLRDDIHAAWALPVGGSYYFNGKAAQKYAALCLMANDAAVTTDPALLQTCLAKLRTVLAPFVANTWTNPLQYDVVYRGLVSSEGFKKNDPGADFGNTMYNDHHFHYGYWVHTAAVLNLLDPHWAQLPQLNAMARLLARDVANYDDQDAFFPKFRSFDWFRGHSYSHGVTPLADGKDQESTSEDVNFAYALLLLGQATRDARMRQVGQLMTRVNARAIQTYFLIDAASDVHPATFKPNQVTGIFFDNKVDYATWFSAEKYCIHGIQMVPVSPVTEFVRTKAFVQQEWDAVLSKEAIVVQEDTTNAWLSLLYANFAAVDKNKAMAVLAKTAMDDGLSRSWALYMAASRAD